MDSYPHLYEEKKKILFFYSYGNIDTKLKVFCGAKNTSLKNCVLLRKRNIFGIYVFDGKHTKKPRELNIVGKIHMYIFKIRKYASFIDPCLNIKKKIFSDIIE